jgi:hypothetical protein
MHAATILAALTGIFTSANSMTVNPSMADGYYTFDVANSTVLHHEPLTTRAFAPVRAMRRARQVAARGVLPNPDVQCTGHDVIQNADEHQAWQILVNYCEGRGNVWKHTGHFAKVGVSIGSLPKPL